MHLFFREFFFVCVQQVRNGCYWSILTLGPCKLIWDYGITVEKLGLWDYTLFEIGITEVMFEIGITGFQSNPNQLPSV